MDGSRALARSERCKVSILIPAYIRPDDLSQTISETLKQNYRDLEIVVVDDGTPNDSIKTAVSAFPSVRYIRTPKNIGLIAARNFGAHSCVGDLIVNLDDDSWLIDYNALTYIVDFMSTNPKVGVVALNIGLQDEKYQWPINANPFPVRHYIGCGNVYRREVIKKVGGYVEEFYRQGEELDRAMRVIDHGYSVLALPRVRVFHKRSPINRNPGKHLAFEAINYLRRELIRVPIILFPLGLYRALRFRFKHRKDMDRGLYAQELFGGRVPILRFVRMNRKPVRISTYLYCLKLGMQGE
jgi:GT2 family glycosyltransferase